jgi:Ulp1 family protease
VGSLPFVPFSQIPTTSNWRDYRQWVSEQKNKGENKENLTLGMVEGVWLTDSRLFSLSPGQWLTDSVIEASIKSVLNSHPLESLVGFLPHFFYTKLMNHGHSNPEMEGCYEYEGVQTWFNKTFGEGKKVSDMSTLVMFQNQNQVHWV